MTIKMIKGSKVANVNPVFVKDWEKDGWSREDAQPKPAPKRRKPEAKVEESE